MPLRPIRGPLVCLTRRKTRLVFEYCVSSRSAEELAYINDNHSSNNHHTSALLLALAPSRGAPRPLLQRREHTLRHRPHQDVLADQRRASKTSTSPINQ